MRYSSILALLIAMGHATAQSPIAGLDDYIGQAMAKWGIPGIAVAVVKDDRVIHARGYGVRAMDKEAPVDERTLFAVASNSKAFTCAVLGSLRDDGKLKWSDRVTDHLPWFQMHDPWVTRDIRVLDLVCHRSGLPTFGGDHLWIASDLSRREILRRVRHMEPTAPFRARFQYQNLMYVAAGEVAAAAGGKSFEELLRERLMAPLGMNDTRLSMAELRAAENVAAAHEIRGGELRIVAYDDADSIMAAGGIKSNVVDMARWLRCHLNAGELEGQRVLSARTVNEMQMVRTPISGRRDVSGEPGALFSGYGMGWGITDYAGHRVIGHGGGLSGMISRTTIVPSMKLGVVVLTNMADNGLPPALTWWVIDRYLAHPAKDWSASYLARYDSRREAAAATEKRNQATPTDGPPASLPLKDYTGRYHSDLSGAAQVTLRDGRLWFSYNPRHEGPLTHVRHDTFRVTWTDPIFDMPPSTSLQFIRDERGKVKQLDTRFYWDPITFQRTSAP